jgi:succinate dehydrogenase / fumarate reductase, cytochrome b subunit
MSDVTQNKRPEFRNIGLTDILLKNKLPLPGKVSIGHRISGVLLFLALAPLLWIFNSSVISEHSYLNVFQPIMAHPISKGIALILIWSVCHHFFAGIRFLLLDIHVGIEKPKARASAALVLVLSLAATAGFGLKLFGII